MTWYPGENRSGIVKPFKPGDIVCTGHGNRLFRVEYVRKMGGDRKVSTATRYYGREYDGELIGVYHGQIYGYAGPEAVENFKKYRNKMDVERNLYAGMTFDDWYACDPRPECRRD